jgi:hypothetical protein
MSEATPEDGASPLASIPAPADVTPGDLAPEDLARLLGMPAPVTPSRSPLQRKIVVAVLIAAIGVGASVMSCVGQSFSLRQARAMEGIEQQLMRIQQICPVGEKAH